MNTSTDAGQRAREVLRRISGAGPNVESQYETWATCIRAMLAFASPVTPAAAVDRDSRLRYDDHGDINAFVVWALKPGQPTIVAVCTSEEICERYRPVAEVHHRATFYVEPITLDHAFGRKDVQSAIYAAAMKGNRHDG